MHPVLQEQVVKHLTSKGVVLTSDFNEFLTDVDKAYTSCDNDRQAFLESSQVLADAQMIAKIGSWKIDTKTEVISWSDELYRIFEVDKETFKPSFDVFLSFVHPEDRERIASNWEKTVKAGEVAEVTDYRLVMPDGRIKWVQSRSYSADGTPDGLTGRLIGTLQDITDRKNLEKSMNEANERLRMLFDFAPDGYFLISDQGVIIDANKALENMTGLNRTEMVGKNIFDLGMISESEMELAKNLLKNVVDQKESPLTSFHISKKDGTTLLVENRGYPLTIQGEKFGLSTVRDISDRQQAEVSIQKRTAELERLNKLMVGRELKMIELKKENDLLKKRAGLN